MGGDTRSVTIIIVNTLDFPLSYERQAINAGQWKTQPPREIKAGKATEPFQAIAGFEENGVDGSVTYIGGPGEFTFKFTNPNSGTNTYSGQPPTNYTITNSTGAGEDAIVAYVAESSP